MIQKEAIEKAIEGGWGVTDGKDATYSEYAYLGYSESGLYEKCYNGAFYSFGQIALDPTFWQALGLGKDDMWFKTKCTCGGVSHPLLDNHHLNCERAKSKRGWKWHAMKFFEFVLDGKDTTQFWSDLLDNKEKTC